MMQHSALIVTYRIEVSYATTHHKQTEELIVSAAEFADVVERLKRDTYVKTFMIHEQTSRCTYRAVRGEDCTWLDRD